MIEKEVIHRGFVKWHLNQRGEEEWPFRPIIHHLSSPDNGDPHDHPWGFRTFIVRGHYTEEVYDLDGTMRLITRREGEVHSVPASYIHRVVDISEGGCWTFIEYGPPEQNNSFYRFTQGGTFKRFWNEPEFKLISKEDRNAA